ncbi:accessory gene regulator B family protein [Paenibacillus gansuensis]|uniref:Accessory gene regulator B family protein n=1 Tax=Paenibacillus gansuensis TaxID=306542 RepID=A0ABW5PDH5_9BACL
MNFIDRTSLLITKFIRENYPEGGSETALNYSVTLLLNTIISTICIVTFGAITGNQKETFSVLFIFIIIRYISGGAHFFSSLSCCIASILILSAIPLIKLDFWYYGLTLNTISLLVFLVKAPNNLENHSSIKSKYYIILKIIASLIIISNFAIQSSTLSLVFSVQAFFITRYATVAISFLKGER